MTREPSIGGHKQRTKVPKGGSVKGRQSKETSKEYDIRFKNRSSEDHKQRTRAPKGDSAKGMQSKETPKEHDIRFKKLSSHAPGMIYQLMKRLDGTYCVPFTTKAIADIFGCSPQDVREDFSPMAKAILLEDLRKVTGSIESSAEHLTTWQCEYRVQIPGHSIRWILSQSTPEKLADGSIIWHGFNTDITDRKKAEAALDKSFEQLRNLLGATVQAIAVTVETRDPLTEGHQRRVSDLARAIAMEMNLSSDEVDGSRTAAAIHDLGKLFVPAEILNKPTKLTDLEWSFIKIHSQTGYDILKDIEFPWPIARMVLEHHERINGSGYPNGLKRDESLLESRILAVADVVEAMASRRTYRSGLGIEAALKEIEKHKKILYDVNVVDACLRLFRERGFQIP
jgi:PAS domain-containing protein